MSLSFTLNIKWIDWHFCTFISFQIIDGMTIFTGAFALRTYTICNKLRSCWNFAVNRYIKFVNETIFRRWIFNSIFFLFTSDSSRLILIFIFTSVRWIFLCRFAKSWFHGLDALVMCSVIEFIFHCRQYSNSHSPYPLHTIGVPNSKRNSNKTTTKELSWHR